MRRDGCRWCRGTAGEVVLDLGLQPACEYFPRWDDRSDDPLFPLRLWLCSACGLAQLADDAELPDEPVGIEPAALAEQRRDAVAVAGAAGLLPAGAAVVEGVTPHGGAWWPELSALGLRLAGPGAPADIVVDGAFGLMHATDQAAAVQGLVDLLAPDGVLLLQFHSLATIVREGQWNAVRLGHHAYYSVTVLQRMLAAHGLTVTDAWTFPLYGGTVLLAARRGGVSGPSVAAAAAGEAGLLDVPALLGLQAAVDRSTAALRELVVRARRTGEQVHGYGAASRAVPLIHLAGVDADLLPAVADASPAKQGCRMPGTAIPVVAPSTLVAARPRTVVVFVRDLLPEVRRALPEVEAGGGSWVVADGEPAAFTAL